LEWKKRENMEKIRRNESCRRVKRKVKAKKIKEEEVYSDYREEIKKRFKRSLTNRYYKFPV
jgi:hypothetical protein